MAIEIRGALAADAGQIAALIGSLGGEFDVAGVAARLAKADSPQLVAESDGAVIGLCGLHQMVALHRSRPVGRITVLVVDPSSRGKGVGKALVDAAERPCTSTSAPSRRSSRTCM